MYIQPDTNVFIYHNVPFDEDYENTMTFSGVAQQFSFLGNNYLKYPLTKHSFQRANRNTIKVEIPVDNLYDCNYMGFVNNAYGDKMFYAFIKEVNYINDNVTEIVYEIDPLQTWMFDYQVAECFVEREHADDDTVGANLVEENIKFGDYEAEDLGVADDIEDLCIALFCTCDSSYQDTSGVFDERMYSGLYPVTFPLTSAGVTACQNWIQGLPLSKLNAIQSACIMPLYFATLTNFSAGAQSIAENYNVQRYNRSSGALERVHNNKTACYPYNFLYVTNNQGKYAEYHYEYFSHTQGVTTCDFELIGDFTPNPSVIMYPLQYKGVPANTDEALIINGYPQVAFDVDSFKAWLAQSASSVGFAGVALAAQQSPFITGPIAQMGRIATVAQVGRLMVEGTLAIAQPPQARGTQQSSVQTAAGIQNYHFYRKHIRPEFATIVDDYFDMFGYACHRVKYPNIFGRVSWNYVKTVGAVIQGSIPADEIRRIKEIFDRGVRFWHYGATIGDYSQNNNPVT